MTNADVALISAAAALTGVILGIAGNAWLEWLRQRRTARKERDQAVAELLTAATDLLQGVQTVRTGYDRSRWRWHLRVAAEVWTAISTALAAQENLQWGLLLDWRIQFRTIDRLLAIDRRMTENQRTVALDLASVLLPRTSRFFAAVVTLTLGPDKQTAAGARSLAPAITDVLDVITARNGKYAHARERAEKALGEFRATADQQR